MLIVDAHLDLSMNAMEWNRDLRLPVKAIREREAGRSDLPDRGKGMVSFPELRAGGIGLVVATQIARYVAPGNPLPGWHSPEQAWAQTQGQLAWYRAMEEAGELFPIRDHWTLEAHLNNWESAAVAAAANPQEAKQRPPCPIGYIRSLEGADSILDLDCLHIEHAEGLRVIGPGHYGPGRYAHGTDASAPLNEQAKELLYEMDDLEMILDVTHLCDKAFWQALELYGSPIWASHNNCRSIVPHNRQFSDEMIKALIEKGAVIGGALDAWMLVPNWKRGVSTPEAMDCGLSKLVDHMDHICQIAGNADHIGIGSDLDGAFGQEQAPYDMDSIADLTKLKDLLAARGYKEADITKVLSGNWINFLKKAWSWKVLNPETMS